MEFSFGLIGFLIVFPLIVAAALLFVRQEGPRRVIVCVSGVVIALASVVLVVMNGGQTTDKIGLARAMMIVRPRLQMSSAATTTMIRAAR